MSKRRDIDFLPVRTVVKFYENHQPNANDLFTKTLRKIGFIDKDWSVAKPPGAPEPSDKEFWIVDVVHETRHGEGRGCFLLHPIRRIDADSLNWLLPGMYSEESYDGCLVLEPSSGGLHWLVSRRLKNVVDGYAVIIRQ